MVWRMEFLVSFPWVGEGWAGEHGAWNGDHGRTYTVARPQVEKQGVVWTRQTGNVKQSWAQERGRFQRCPAITCTQMPLELELTA